jgi:hypothetical protein
MKKEIINKNDLNKWEVYYEDNETYSIWRYDKKISGTNPYSVETFFKDNNVDVKLINKLKNK